MSELYDIFPELADLHRYKVKKKVGQSPISTDFVVVDTYKSKEAILKVFPLELQNRQFEENHIFDSFQALKKVSDPCCSQIYDTGKVGGLYYLVQELIQGEILEFSDRYKEGLPEPTAVKFIAKILQGLMEIHSHELIHGFLCPSNIIITPSGNPVLVNYGLHHFFVNQFLDTDRSFSDALYYVAPEILVGQNGDSRSDIYAFGVLFYTLLTGDYPYNHDDFIDFLFKKEKIALVPPEKRDKQLHPSLIKIISRCLEQRVEDRYQSLSNLQSDLMILYCGKKIIEGKRKKLVLVVDDEKAIASMLRQMFTILDMDVLLCQNGTEAVEQALKNKPDLICMDIMMPEMNGLEAAEIILSYPELQKIPIVMMTARSDRDYMIYSRSLGITDYLTKPISFNDIEKRLDFWLQQK